MKTQKPHWFIPLAAVLAISSPFPVRAQGFINLDFESATIVSAGNSLAQFGPAFPGWRAYYNSFSLSPTTPITYNTQRAGTSGLGLVDRNHSGPSISNFTALLQGGTGPNEVAVSLAQTGQVPSDSLSLQFLASTIRPVIIGTGETFTVSMNGQLLSYAILQEFGNFRLYGADVSAFAGQTVELSFMQPSGPVLFDNLFLDNISFSPNPVPEPSTWTLLGLGSALFWCAARRRGK